MSEISQQAYVRQLMKMPFAAARKRLWAGGFLICEEPSGGAPRGPVYRDSAGKDYMGTERAGFLRRICPLVLLAATLGAAQSVPQRMSIPAIARSSNGAIVSIVMFDRDGGPVAQGSGFLVSRDGLIITNYHVIRVGTSAVVKLPDGAFYGVDGVVAFDKHRDLALIRAHGENFRTLRLGDSSKLEVGQQVVAIGSPLSLESTVSNGVISGLRTGGDLSGRLLQITAPISPGSSGGPLFDMDGQVIGITTMYIKGGENLNFAIPINDAKPLLRHGRSTPEPFADSATAPARHVPVSDAANVQINSPTFRYYQAMLAANVGYVMGATYACFSDDPGQGVWRMINILPAGGLGLTAAGVIIMDKGKEERIFEFNHFGEIKKDAGGGIDVTFPVSLYSENSAAYISTHKDDYLEWSSSQVLFHYGSHNPPPNSDEGYAAMDFVMGRPSGTYVMTFTPEGNITEEEPNGEFVMVPYSTSPEGMAMRRRTETGQCVRVPGSKTLEQKIGELSR
ncbi:MAG: S1C family serine protease [Terriglobales bacterium]